MEGEQPKVKHQHKDIGDCPNCGAPTADYTYVIEGPVDPDREMVRIRVTIKCPMCGYTDTKKILLPVKALHLIKYLLVQDVRPAIEKIYVLHRIRVVGEAEEADNDDSVEA